MNKHNHVVLVATVLPLLLLTTTTHLVKPTLAYSVGCWYCSSSRSPSGKKYKKTPNFAKATSTRTSTTSTPPSKSWSLSAAAAARRNALEGGGVPSYVGWRSDRVNQLTEWADADQANRPIICTYQPRGLWLWTKWKGTVLKLVFPSVVAAVLASICIDVWVRKVSTTTWPLFAVPPSSERIIQALTGMEQLWSYHSTLCSFLMSFFTSQAYAYWQKVYNTTRMIQGRINDYCMLLTMAAERKTAADSDVDEENPTGLTKRSQKLIETCSRWIRMSHTLFWAATPTASNGVTDVTNSTSYEHPPENANFDDEHIGPLLLSPYGLHALVQSGQLTKEERMTLLRSGLSPMQYSNVLLEWVGMATIHGLNSGALVGKDGLEANLLKQLTSLRASMFDIDDFRAGRMPLAYVQLVQVLCDSLVALAPFALYAKLGTLSIPLVGLMALFFRGLLALSKSFLDPFGVEGYRDQTIRVDVLVSELNFGASRRWIRAAKTLPADFDSDDDDKALKIYNKDTSKTGGWQVNLHSFA